jgi:hypothetical protein
MEIVIRTDDKQAVAGPAAQGAQPRAEAQAEPGGESVAAAAADLAARARAEGAIDAGPAHVPAEQEQDQPPAQVAGRMAAPGQEGAAERISAGAAPSGATVGRNATEHDE